ncbi:serine threonine- kinase protein [Rutstroemia sp. NJR-2017a BBW]|nr:serine threonine- kinase protein [Rutstroemia sp. NJR-2017a BBW]
MAEEGLAEEGQGAIPRNHYLGSPATLATNTIRALRFATFRSNPWRTEDAKLSWRNLEIDAAIAAGGSGMVFRGRNRDTNLVYALKISKGRRDPQVDWEDVYGDPSPTLSRSSQASIVHPVEMFSSSLGLKREREARTYLRFIKTGHKNICNFEGWCELDILGDWRFLHVFELCDAGTLYDIISECSKRNTFPPETFIPRLIRYAIRIPLNWRVFEQLFDALAFLHGEHPQYKDHPRFHPLRSTVVLDIKEDNIFFQWPQEMTEHYYPDLKLGDFGSCVHLPVGGQRESKLYNVVSEPPEGIISAKYDVWCGASMIFYLAKLAFRPNMPTPPNWSNTSRNREILREDPRRIEQHIDDHLTDWLEDDIKFALVMDPDKRPTAWEVVERIRSGSYDRRNLQYMPLPDWVNLDYFMGNRHRFNPKIAASINRQDHKGGWQNRLGEAPGMNGENQTSYIVSKGDVSCEGLENFVPIDVTSATGNT